MAAPGGIPKRRPHAAIVPSVLDQPTFQQYPAPWAASLTPAYRRELLCGLGLGPIAGRAESTPPTIDPMIDNVDVPTSLPRAFDINSSGGWATNLAVARQGLQWLATRPSTSTLTTSLHLDPLSVEWRDAESQRLHHRSVPVHYVPHLPLGRLRGFEAMELFHSAVDDEFLTSSFFDVAKETCLPSEIPQEALELTWRRCCLSRFEGWLVELDTTLETLCTLPPSAESEGIALTQISLVPTEAIPDTQPPESSVAIEVIPDTQPLTAPCALRRAGLLYAQLYNTSKEIFTVGKVYPFGNLALDTLALLATLVRILQHTGGAHAHSRATLLRGYLHTKARCHAALKGAQGRSYSAREEYRVTAELLEALDNEMITQEADEHRI
ncbi:hypothetical protein N7523_005512 [Penicillium sp. IBT 18751x]|nr:hypothetical protein N7523_005512 [Penicillium sp. IBT 18751x]